MPAYFTFIVFSLMLSACEGPSTYIRHAPTTPVDADSAPAAGKDSPMSLIGEKFFRESRFSQFFFANSNGVLSLPAKKGDPVVETLETLTKMYPNPYQGQAMSCAACHFVDQMQNVPGLGVRAYTDFSRRSRIPNRGDGQERTVRNSPNMVSMALRDGMFLHGDGEFSNPEDLVRAGYLGRNMGWMPEEKETAIHHIAQVVRKDTGAYPTDTDLGGLKYVDLLKGSPQLPAKFQLPAQYRLDISKASDQEIFDAVIRLVGEYLRSLDYSRDADGTYNGSPYDVFLKKNHLPQAPAEEESALAYSLRLYRAVFNRKSLSYVSNADQKFKIQQQDFVFSEKELQGFKVFFGSGRCVQCHTAPDFTDHLFHNTGVSQDDYDRVHGSGSFMNLQVPNLEERNANANLYLPASETFPRAKSIFRSIPVAKDSQRADLGAWNVFGNPSIPHPQSLMRTALCQSLFLNCALISDSSLLDHSLAMIKTPSTRDLGQSAPYLHTGQADKLEDVVDFYIKFSQLAKNKQVRNADPRLAEIHLTAEDKEDLVLFLKSLNEDYN